MATLRGEPVDRPPVSFYELSGTRQDPDDPDPFNIFNDPSWKPLLDLVDEKTDWITMTGAGFKNRPPNPHPDMVETETWEDENRSRFTRKTIHTPGGDLTSLSRRDRDVNTSWAIEHLLNSAEDLEKWLTLPVVELTGEVDVDPVLEREKRIGDAGIVMLGCGDPVCAIAGMFDMAEFTIVALTEQELMHRALRKAARGIMERVEAIAEALPGRLWRVVGPEYVSPPYLPPALFQEYVTTYDTPIVEAIQKHGGYARIHSHGNLRDILDHIAATGCMGIDPIEPPPQGDVTMAYVRKNYGRDWVLFGNLEVSDIENLPTERFAEKVRTALIEGTEGEGKGMVLMPSACPYGRKLPELTLRNYEKMVELVEKFPRI
jgi:uroporphyrinogen-III decarboxylase